MLTRKRTLPDSLVRRSQGHDLEGPKAGGCSSGNLTARSHAAPAPYEHSAASAKASCGDMLEKASLQAHATHKSTKSCDVPASWLGSCIRSNSLCHPNGSMSHWCGQGGSGNDAAGGFCGIGTQCLLQGLLPCRHLTRRKL